MSQRDISSNGVTATLWSIIDEIDDDDEDIIEVSIEVSNDSGQDLWDISGDVRAMDGTHGIQMSGPERIGTSHGDELIFWVPIDTGAWLFKLDYNTDSGHGAIELGPFTNELRIEERVRPKKVAIQSTGSEQMKVAAGLDNPLAAAFGSAMDGFGEVVEMTDPVLSEAAASSDPMEAAFAGGLLESQQAPTQIQTASPPTNPPGPPSPSLSAAPEPPTGPPSGPPSPPPSAAPGPPSGPPSPPPSTAPGPPSGPPPSTKSGGPPGPPPS